MITFKMWTYFRINNKSISHPPNADETKQNKTKKSLICSCHKPFISLHIQTKSIVQWIVSGFWAARASQTNSWNIRKDISIALHIHSHAMYLHMQQKNKMSREDYLEQWQPPPQQRTCTHVFEYNLILFLFKRHTPIFVGRWFVSHKEWLQYL